MFGRRRARPAAVPDPGSAAQGAVQASAASPVNPAAAHVGGQTGWAPFGVGAGQHPSDQIGAYAAPPLNFYPALVNDVQKENGIAGLSSHWYVPSRTWVVPEQGVQFTGAVMTPGNNVGGRLDGQGFSGLMGPIAARLMRTRVTAAAMQQTQRVGDVSDLIGSWMPAPTVQGSDY